MSVDDGGAGKIGRLFEVDLRLFGLVLRCPFAVARDLGRYLRTASAVSPGQVVKKLFSIAWIQVDMEGLKQALCRKSISCGFVFWS